MTPFTTPPGSKGNDLDQTGSTANPPAVEPANGAAAGQPGGTEKPARRVLRLPVKPMGLYKRVWPFTAP